MSNRVAIKKHVVIKHLRYGWFESICSINTKTHQILNPQDEKNRTFQVALSVKNLSATAGDTRDWSLIPGSRRCPGGGNGSQLQCSCLENSMSRGAWSMGLQRVGHN